MESSSRKMPGPHTKSHLAGRIATTITAKLEDLSNNKLKSDLSFNADVSGWVDTVNQTLNDKLLAAADSGRSFYIIESPIFINPGKLANGTRTYDNKDIHHEATFRAYLKSLCNPATQFDVDPSITVTESVPPRPAISGTPTLPQNVMFRYRFSW